jgi:hypothetical protein
MNIRNTVSCKPLHNKLCHYITLIDFSSLLSQKRDSCFFTSKNETHTCTCVRTESLQSSGGTSNDCGRRRPGNNFKKEKSGAGQILRGIYDNTHMISPMHFNRCYNCLLKTLRRSDSLRMKVGLFSTCSWCRYSIVSVTHNVRPAT